MRMDTPFFASFLLCFLVALVDATVQKGVSYSQRSFTIDGEPTLLLSGSIHYNRIPPSDWGSVLSLAKELGLNTIQTYVIWSEHEPSPGKFHWEGYADLLRFIRLAADLDLHVVVRVGPYICGEYYFGGLPLWLRYASDIQCFRCADPSWKHEMERWVNIVVDKLRPYLHDDTDDGGPIIALQIENEYPRDNEYLEWAVDMARSTTVDVPWFICHDVPQCIQLNHKSENDKVLCSINGFWMDAGGGGDQPGTEYFEVVWNKRGGVSNQPAMWTEDQGWFDLWNVGHRVRFPSDQMYGMARFFAYGGSYHNLYMLTGGNNYGRKAGRYSTTAYAPDTVIDSFLLRHEPKYSLYQRFFQALQQVSKQLLDHPPAKPLQVADMVEAHVYGNLVFLSNYGESKTSSKTVDYQGQSLHVPNHTVVLLDTTSATILFNTSDTYREHGDDSTSTATTASQEKRLIELSGWKCMEEQVGYGSIKKENFVSPEQLNITDNKSDYLWYSFQTTNDASTLSIEPIGDGTIFYVYMDGKLVVPTARDENHQVATIQRRKLLTGTDDATKVDILSVGMGLNNWGMGPTSGKGIHSVTVGNDTVVDVFSTAWKLRGESLEIYSRLGSKRVADDWEPVLLLGDETPQQGLMWFQGSFIMPSDLVPTGGAQPNQTALVANLSGLYKGVVYVNSFNLGRYWIAPGKCKGDCAPPRNGPHCYIHWKHCNEPTQSLYHIPFEILLQDEPNILTVFEETAPPRRRDLGKVMLEVIHEHPY